jgi:Uma2 family endonuclease
MATITSQMTTEELLALPDDGIDRELIRGEVRESPMTTRGMPHCLAAANVAFLLGAWLRTQRNPRGRIYAGDARVRIRREPDTFFGTDIAYISADLAERTPRTATFMDGVPVLAVEILSPSDTVENITEKVREYLDSGVALVWQINPYDETVIVHSATTQPVLFNNQHELTAEPHLPGFHARVADIFAS